MQLHRNAAGKTPRNKRENKNGKVETVKIDKRVMKKALQLAGGDATRLTINKDGSVDVK